MNDRKDFMIHQINLNKIKDWVTSKKKLHFDSSYSSKRNIRFTTETLESLLPLLRKENSVWDNKYPLMYEINFGENRLFNVTCTLSLCGLTISSKKKSDLLMDSLGLKLKREDMVYLRTYGYSKSYNNIDMMIASLEYFYEYELPYFETLLNCWKKDPSFIIHSYPTFYTEGIQIDKSQDEPFFEGSTQDIYTNKYERNVSARKQCIQKLGAYCHICGFDFGKVYGKDFEGKIEVHHIIPLSQIKKNYKVDPYKDLIPVCSNCHTALHSKKDGVYTPDELKKLMIKNK